jgi:hypothetical protein
VTSEPGNPRCSSHIVIRTTADITHPHVNVWVPRGQLPTDGQGNVHLSANLQDTFSGVAQPSTEIELGENGTSAQVYQLVSVDLSTPPRRSRRHRPRRGEA